MWVRNLGEGCLVGSEFECIFCYYIVFLLLFFVLYFCCCYFLFVCVSDGCGRVFVFGGAVRGAGGWVARSRGFSVR